VIITDDGMATGRTILATIKMLKSRRPQKLVVAVPVASRQAALRIRQEVDDFICLYTPSSFTGVSRFYADFSQTTDEEVMMLLKELNTETMQYSGYYSALKPETGFLMAAFTD